MEHCTGVGFCCRFCKHLFPNLTVGGTMSNIHKHFDKYHIEISFFFFIFILENNLVMDDLLEEEIKELNMEDILLAVWTKYRIPFLLADDQLFKILLNKSKILQSISSFKIRKKILDLCFDIKSSLVYFY